MPDFDNSFTEEQQNLIDGQYDAILVTAPAGAGKTRLLVGRARALIESGVPQDRICILTFTQKSAQDLRRRLSQNEQFGSAQVVCSTFHGFALECLRSHCGDLGLSSDFGVISPRKAATLLMHVANRVLTNRGLDESEAQKLYQQLSRSINCNESVESQTEVHDLGLNAEERARILDAFVEEKLNANVVDYDDLLFMFTLLMDSNEAYRAYWSERFIHVLVDEYQDVNDLQAHMVSLLSSCHGHVFAIGDHAQAIYGFRGANVRHFREFLSRYPNGLIKRLSVNFRSTKTIVDSAETLLSSDQNFKHREIRAQRDQGTPIYLVGSQSQESEARFIAREVKRLIDLGVPPAQIAILVRMRKQAGPIELWLRQYEVPLEVKTGPRFLDRSHIRDMVALLILVQQGDDTDAWRHLIALQKGVGPVSTDRIMGVRFGHSDAGLTQLQSRQSKTVIQRIESVVSKVCSQEINLVTAYAMLHELTVNTLSVDLIQDLCGLESLWQKSTGVAELTDGMAFAGSLDELEGVDESRVTLLSIHQSKGLEWHSVFVPGLNEGTLPVFGSGQRVDGVSEERRLMYVASTRASDRLYLCCHAETELELGRVGGAKSRFLNELIVSAPSLLEGLWVGSEHDD